jgi:fibronectin type 3 domain-containing protein
MDNNASSATLKNVTFSGNSAQSFGGGMGNSNSNLQIRNTILWGNTAPTGTQINNVNSTSTLNDSVIDGVCPAGSTCTNVITTDPMLGTLGNYGGFTLTIPLLAHSSAINTGNDATCEATDQRGVARPQGEHCDIGAYEYVDTTAPTVDSFTVTTPTNNLNIPITTFTATDDVAVKGFMITETESAPSAGAAGWAGSAPASYTVATDGSYTLYPWAKDGMGNVSAIFASPREVVVDTIAPDTQIDTHPADPSNSSDASFTFSSADGTATFECSLEGGTYAACISPWEYTGLVDGVHTFAVRAMDAVVNVDLTPATYTWTSDTIAPDTQINSHPADLSNSTDASFTFSGWEGTDTFECSLDGGADEACTSPWEYTGLVDGEHTFAVRATDAAGNVDDSPASQPWTIDTIVPDTQIDTQPADPSNSGDASFTFSSADGTATFECSLEGSDYEACTSPWEYTGLGDGEHTFAVRATDAAGNVDDTPATDTWTILLPPAVPVGVSASDGTYTDKVQVSWTASSGATSYNVYRASSAVGTKTLLGGPASTTFDDTTATPGITYTYWVVACIDANCSDYSTSDTGWRKLLPPTNIQASDGTYTDKVRVSWTAVSGATSYKVYRATSATGTKVYRGTFTGTTFDDTTPTPGITYTYWVVAYKGTSNSAYSTANTGWRKLLPPTSVLATDGTYTDKVRVTWIRSTGATAYKVYRATSATGTKVYRGLATGAYFDDTTGTPGITYYYWVVAYRSASYSGYSTYNTGWRKLLPPTNVQASDGTYSDKVRVTWTASVGATSYKVYRAATATGTKVYRGSSTGVYFDDTTATPGVTYYYWVVAYRGTSLSAYSTYNTGWRR